MALPPGTAECMLDEARPLARGLGAAWRCGASPARRGVPQVRGGSLAMGPRKLPHKLALQCPVTSPTRSRSTPPPTSLGGWIRKRRGTSMGEVSGIPQVGEQPAGSAGDTADMVRRASRSPGRHSAHDVSQSPRTASRSQDAIPFTHTHHTRAPPTPSQSPDRGHPVDLNGRQHVNTTTTTESL